MSFVLCLSSFVSCLLSKKVDKSGQKWTKVDKSRQKWTKVDKTVK